MIVKVEGEKGEGGGVCERNLVGKPACSKVISFSFHNFFLSVYTFLGSILNFFFPMDICLFFGLFLLKMKKKKKIIRTINNYSDSFYYSGPKTMATTVQHLF